MFKLLLVISFLLVLLTPTFYPLISSTTTNYLTFKKLNKIIKKYQFQSYEEFANLLTW